MFLNIVIRMIWKTNLVFWICFIVTSGSMESRKNCEQFQETKYFSGGKVCYTLSNLFMVNAEKSDMKLKNWGTMPTCYNLYVLLLLSFQISVSLKLCIMNTLVHFVLRQSCRILRNVSLCGPHIPLRGLIKRSYHGWMSMMTSSDVPSFSLASPSHAIPAILKVHHCLNFQPQFFLEPQFTLWKRFAKYWTFYSSWSCLHLLL